MTNSDKELLTLAARAAEIEIEEWQGNYAIVNGGNWNPLSDEGDLHRLARKLKMRIDFDLGDVACDIGCDIGDVFWLHEAFTPGNDSEEAMAILRAAAAAGRGIKL